MSKRSDKPEDLDALREKIIGLGERSIRKSYYPKLQQQLEEMEQLSRRHELILESSGEGIFGLDMQGNYTFMNKAAAAMLGYEPGELIGRHSHSCIHHTRADGTPYPEEECRTYAAFRDGIVRHVDDEVFCTRDGTRFPVEYTSTPILEGGQILGAVVTFSDITERRRAEEDLKLTQFSVDHASVSAFLIGRDARILYANEQACRSLQYSREELLGMTVPDLDPNVPLSAWNGLWDRLKKEGTVRVETQHRKKDGTLIPIEISANYVSFGGREYDWAFSLDISERKKAGQELARMTRKNELILESAGDGIFGMNRDGNHILVNSAALKMLGYKSEDLMGRDSHPIWHHTRADGSPYPEDECSIYKTSKDGISRHVDDEVFWRKNGSSIPVEYTTTPIYEGSAIVGTVVTFRDITERKRAEEELRKSEQKLRAIFDQTFQFIGLMTIDGALIAVNRAALRFSGVEEEDVIGKPFWETPWWTHSAELQERLREAVKRAAEGKFLRFEAIHPAADGSLHDIDFSLKPVLDEAGNVVLLIPEGRDITERKRAEEALRKSEALLKETQKISKVGGWELDVQTGKTTWTDEVYRIYGVSTDFDTGNIPAAMSFYDPDSLLLLKEAVRNAIEKGEPYDLDLKFTNAQGEHLWVRTIGRPAISNGRVVRISGNIIDITERKRMEDEIRHMAHHDLLTGLPNRRLFRDITDLELAQARRNRKKIAILFLDLDRFKEINDTLGHEVGDELLKHVTVLFRNAVRESDTVARIGGDEFNIILADITRPEDVSDIAQKIIKRFRSPFSISGHELNVTTSIGISVYPDDSTEIDTLLRYADIAMYHAKESGRNTFRFYDPAINVRSIERIRLENMLRRSIELGELVIHYQPQIHIRSKQMMCAEALVRWRHPERGLLTPDQFLPLAEETGFIAEIDDWALKNVCDQMRSWINCGLAPVCVTVNLSSRQFQRPDLATRISSVLRETGITPDCLDIEVTENTAMSNIEKTAAQLRELREMGVHISIDDFGTGYSSLNYLKKLPIERLKIDKSFIQDIAKDPDDRAIIGAVTSMAHKMGIKTVAEGVETEEQLEFLRSSECDEAQGFLFSEPLPPEQFTELVTAGKKY